MDKLFYLCDIFWGRILEDYETAKDNKIYNEQRECFS